MGSYVKTTTGSDTCVVPSGATNVVKRVWGGGGGGRGGTTASSGRAGAGGGGAFSSQTDNVSGTYDVFVGNKGSGGVAGASGTDGGDSYIRLSGVDKALAKGGKGSTSRSGGAGGASASGVGDTKYSGGSGGNNAGGDGGGGGGGSSAGTAANGNAGESNGDSRDPTLGGLGAAAPSGGGNGGEGGSEIDGSGSNASSPGGGGGGGSGGGGNSTTTNGGDGGVGKVEITWTDPPPPPTTFDVSIGASAGLSVSWTFYQGVNATLVAVPGVSDSVTRSPVALAYTLGIVARDLESAVRGWAISATLAALGGIYEVDGKALGVSLSFPVVMSPLGDVRIGFPLASVLGAAFGIGSTNALPKILVTSLSALVACLPRPKNQVKLTVPTPAVVGVVDALKPRSKLSVTLSDIVGLGPTLAVRSFRSISLGSRVQVAATTTPRVSITTGLYTLCSQLVAGRRVTTSAAVISAVGGLAESSSLGRTLSITLAGVGSVAPSARNVIKTSTALSAIQTVLPTLRQIARLSSAIRAVAGDSESLRGVRNTGLSLLAVMQLAVTPSPSRAVSTSVSSKFNVSDVYRVLSLQVNSLLASIAALIETPAVRQIVSESLRANVSTQQVYSSGFKVASVRLAAAIGLPISPRLRAEAGVSLVAGAVIADLMEHLEHDLVYFVPDGRWTQADIIDESFSVQESEDT